MEWLGGQSFFQFEQGDITTRITANHGRTSFLFAHNYNYLPVLTDHMMIGEYISRIRNQKPAAVAGGYTSVACIPSTDPPIDTQAGVEYVIRKAARSRPS